MTKRVAIFASGGGSNAVKLMESMQGDHPAMPALIVTNQPNAGVIVQAERFGVACEVIDHKPYAGDRAAFETEIQNRLIPYQIDGNPLPVVQGAWDVFTQPATSDMCQCVHTACV